MVARYHLLLISEDLGNTQALTYARAQLTAGNMVSWICSTPTSAKLDNLEEMAALKNVYIGTLSLLVITREESQPFAPLTGALDAQRLDDCAGLLFNPTDISECALAAGSDTAASIAPWLQQQLPAVPVTTFDIAANSSAKHSSAENYSVPNSGELAQASESQNTDNIEITVVLQGRERRFEMSRSAGTLLDGAEDAGIDLPFSCRGGVCSTCRARVRAGEVALIENYALEEWELDAGFTLPCQAEPISRKITLDYDEV